MAPGTRPDQAAMVAQLVGADVSALITMIIRAVQTARHNRSECEQLAHRALMIAQLLSHVQEPEAVQPLAGLGDTLRDAHELVVSCQRRSTAYQFVMARRQAERFREVQSKIDSYLILFPVISHISITRRLDCLNGFTRGEPSQLPESSRLQESTEIAQEVLPHVTEEFTLVEILAATNNFARDTVIASRRYGTVYRGRLQDGRKVAIKRIEFRPNISTASMDYLTNEFHTELDILSQLRHKHIICLLGWCVSKEKHLLTRQRKVTERMIVYEYMENGTLFDHLHPDEGSSVLSLVTVSWKMRIDVLLAVSRAIEHLHCHANPPIIHCDINSAGILFDANWVPRLSDFRLSVTWDMANEESGLEVPPVIGTFGYLAPEYAFKGCLKPASDVYSLGVVMLEVLTGKNAISQEKDKIEFLTNLASFAPHIIEAGNIGELLDRRPIPEPTPWQLQALEHVTQIALCCLKWDKKDRPAISDIVANLEMVRELMHRDETGSIDESLHARRVPSAGLKSYQMGPSPHRLPLQHLEDITGNFCDERILGSGGFGVVYKGVLKNGELVAVKKLVQSTPKTQKQFENEVDLLMTLEHQNIVRLRGYCYDTQLLHVPYEGKIVLAEKTKHFLCLECMPNGSLDRHITDADVSSGLDWRTRCRIIEGISLGLQYLHEESNVPIIHLDLKPANILLDENFIPKITDFALSRLFDRNQTIRTATATGTLGYMAREYQERGEITPMADIFSLGVIIMEVITGHKKYPYPDDIKTSSKGFIEREVQKWRSKMQEEPGYTSLEAHCQQIERFIQIGLICVNPEPKKRPTMKKIIDMLQGLESMKWYISNEAMSPVAHV